MWNGEWMVEKKWTNYGLILTICILAGYLFMNRYSDNIKTQIDAWILKTPEKYYLTYIYAKEEDNHKSILKTPFDLSMEYMENHYVETLPEPDQNDYTDEIAVEYTLKENGESEEPAKEITEPASHAAVDISSLNFETLMSRYYTVTSATKVYPEDFNVPEMLATDMRMSHDNSTPQILIYHTHGQEGFADTVEGDESTRIVGVGTYLTELLQNRYGYNVIHVTDSYDLVDGKLDRSKAYDYAYQGISRVLEANPSIEVVIDLHRDGVNENLHLVTEVNGKPTAQIMFFNGMSRLASGEEISYLNNPNRSYNLAFSLQMKLKAEEFFPGFTRKNYLQAYEYNLQVRPKAMLIEAGAQTNTVQEEKNAMEPLSELLHMVLQ